MRKPNTMDKIEKMERRKQAILEAVNRLLSEKEKKSETLTKGQKIVMESWKSLKNKTKVFETIPLVYALSDKQELSANDFMSLLDKNYDWDTEGSQWLKTLLKKINYDKDAYNTFLQVVVGNAIDLSKPSLKDIYGGRKIDGFIHGSINKFYASLKKNSKHSQESKTFTADVVLIWGPQTAYKINKIVDGDLLKKLKADKNSLVTLADGKTVIACVSLKALEGRVGKVTAIFASMVGESKSKNEPTNKEFISEGILDSIKNAAESAGEFAKDLIDKVKEGYKKFTDWIKNVTSLVKSVFTPSNPEVLNAESKNVEIISDANELLKEFDQLVVDHYNQIGKPLTEASENEPIEITTCFRDQVIKWYDKFDRDSKKYNEVFRSFAQKASKYSNTNFFRISFTALDDTKKEFNREMKRVESFVKKIQSAKEAPTDSKRKTCQTLIHSNKPVTITRSELKLILMSNANFISIQILNTLVDQYLSKSKKLNTKESMESLISFSTKLNAEAIFGGALEVPLIKYDGTKIIRYGSRDAYEKNHSAKLVGYFNSVKTLPIIGIKIYPPESKEVKGQKSSYYSIIMYSISDYKMQQTGQVSDSDFIYNVVSFKCNSGSSFAFTVESDTTTTGDKIVVALKSDKEVSL